MRVLALGLLLWISCAAQNGLVYQVFVRSFADTPADTRAAGEIGDLRGLRENLDYINDGKPASGSDLEAGVLWLMPVFPSPTYHGYDVTDFRAINPDYGTLDDMRQLVAEAHRRGLRVILDVPFNHTSSQHPWFREAVENPNSRFRKWYRFGGSGDHWHVVRNSSGAEVRYFGLFFSGMPDLDFENSEVRREILDIARFWIADIGVDGFRIDAAKHIYGDTFGSLSENDILRNNDWWREFSDFVYKLKPDAILVGEVLGDKETLRRHAWGSDALLDEPFLKGVRARMSAGFSGFLTGWKEFLRSCRDVNRLAHPNFSRSEPFHLFTFAASHDESPRLASFLADRKRAGMVPSVDEAYRVGMYLLLSIAMHPVLYNGDEVMQPGYKWNGNGKSHPTAPGDGSGIYDETLREPFPWRKTGAAAPQASWFASRFDKPDDGVSVEEQSGASSMLSLVQALSRLRTEHPGFGSGEVGTILADSAEWIVFEKADRYLVLMNTTGSGMDYRFHDRWFPHYRGAQLIFWSDGKAKNWKDETASSKHIESSVFVPPYGLVVIRSK